MTSPFDHDLYPDTDEPRLSPWQSCWYRFLIIGVLAYYLIGLGVLGWVALWALVRTVI